MKKSSARSSDRNHFKTAEIPFWEDVAYCDAGVNVLPDGFTVDRISLAFWYAGDLSFSIKYFPIKPTGKRDAVNIGELKAIFFAAESFPSAKIKTDSQTAIIIAEHFFPEVAARLEWIPREKNGIANLLCKLNKQGSGYIAFNKCEVARGWMDLVWLESEVP